MDTSQNKNQSLPTKQLADIAISDIHIDEELNCRARISYQNVETIIESIRSLGLQTPVDVEPASPELAASTGKKYQLVAGFRRTRACQFLKHETIRAFVFSEYLTSDQRRLYNLIENIERRELNMMEEAKAVDTMSELGMSTREIADMLRRSINWVNVRRKIKFAAREVQEASIDGRISDRQLLKILKIDDHTAQTAVLDRYLQEQKEDLKAQCAYRVPLRKQIEEKHAEQKDSQGTAAKGTKSTKSNRSKKKHGKPNVGDINYAITVMLDASVVGIGPRALAYVLGWITLEELITDIQKIQPISKLADKDEQATDN